MATFGLDLVALLCAWSGCLDLASWPCLVVWSACVVFAVGLVFSSVGSVFSFSAVGFSGSGLVWLVRFGLVVGVCVLVCGGVGLCLRIG